jgi:UDP-N-acetylglucosamine 2-epimerase
MMKTVVTITGIRPDFIRMSEIFKKLDKNFNHILIHTGQHYDKLLSDVFFEDLEIRKPDYNLRVGSEEAPHHVQQARLSTGVIQLLKEKQIHPDIILFLGDSNSVLSAVPLRKEGYVIGHIEAGMRSGDKRMLEEINRTVCDHCSNYHFVYHRDYGLNLTRENLPKDNIFVIGNTIVEPALKIKKEVTGNKTPAWYNKHIILDIHRPENFKHKDRLKNILMYANDCKIKYEMPVYMLGFKRTLDYIKKFDLDASYLKTIDLMSYKNYIANLAKSVFIISDSGTAQEEPALFGIPVIVPRDYTERPQSIKSDCSYMLDVNSVFNPTWKKSLNWIAEAKPNPSWMGEGDASDNVIQALGQIFS